MEIYLGGIQKLEALLFQQFVNIFTEFTKHREGMTRDGAHEH